MGWLFGGTLGSEVVGSERHVISRPVSGRAGRTRQQPHLVPGGPQGGRTRMTYDSIPPSFAVQSVTSSTRKVYIVRGNEARQAGRAGKKIFS